VLSDDKRQRVAYHEMGHALVAASLPGVDPVLKISIIPRGVGTLGYTMQRPTEDHFLLADSNLRNRIAVPMGGRAAEALVFGNASTGAADDFQRATDITLMMVTRYGMAETTGLRTYAPPPQSFLGMQGIDRPTDSEATIRELDLAARDIVAAAYHTALCIPKASRADLDPGAEMLLAKETITADDCLCLRRAGEAGSAEHREPERSAQ